MTSIQLPGTNIYVGELAVGVFVLAVVVLGGLQLFLSLLLRMAGRSARRRKTPIRRELVGINRAARDGGGDGDRDGDGVRARWARRSACAARS